MIFDSVTQAYTVLAANFATDLAALATAKGVTITSTVTPVMWQKAETFNGLGVSLPACGIYARDVDTQAKDQGKRDSRVAIVFDYYAEHTDANRLAKQLELAAEALMRTVDRLAASGGGVFGAGEEPGSVRIQLSDGWEAADKTNYWRRVTVTVPVWDRDTVA